MESEITEAPIVIGKTFCPICNYWFITRSRNRHEKSKRHKEGISKDEPKIKCECGGIYYRALFYDHAKTDKHIYYINKIEKQNQKLELYEQNKNTKRCCSNCLKIDIDEKLYIEDLKLCKPCEEILKNIDKPCVTCGEIKNISLFEKPYFYRCKKCAAEKAIRNYHYRKNQNY